MLQMKNPVVLRARLIRQVRAAGTVCHLGFASATCSAPEHYQGWRLESVPCLLWFRVASVVPPHWPWLMGFSWQLQDLRMAA